MRTSLFALESVITLSLTGLVMYSFRGEWRLLCAALCPEHACLSIAVLLVVIVCGSIPPSCPGLMPVHCSCFSTGAWPPADLLLNHIQLTIFFLPLNVGLHGSVSSTISSSLASGTPLRLNDWLAVVWEVSRHYSPRLLCHFCTPQ